MRAMASLISLTCISMTDASTVPSLTGETIDRDRLKRLLAEAQCALRFAQCELLAAVGVEL